MRAGNLSFLDDHPRGEKIQLQTRPREAVVRLSGERLPDTALLGDEVEDVEERDKLREKFGAAALVMFLPWRDSSCIFEDEDDGSWWAAYQRHLAAGNFPKLALDVMRNMQAHHEKHVRDADDAKTVLIREVVNPSVEDEDAEASEENQVPVDAGDVDESFDLAAAGENKVEGLQSLPGDYSFVAIEQVRGETITSEQLAMALQEKIPEPLRTQSESTGTLDDPKLLADVVVGACQDLTAWTVPWAMPSDGDNKDYPTIGEVSRRHTLNVQQHKAFVLFAACLLEGLVSDVPEEKESFVVGARGIVQRILKSATDQNKDEDDLQLRFFLSGPAGTGKSQVVKALVDFARQWKCADALVLTATSGIAGVLIGGGTYHSRMGFGGHDSDYDKKPAKVTESDRQRWSRAKLLLIDEVSMLDCNGLYNINKKLQQLKDPKRLFGGIHIVFCGDLFQIAAIGGSLYGNPKSAKGQAGKALWDQLNAALELTKSMRQINDAQYAELCDRFQKNQPTLADLKLLNTRVISDKLVPPAGATFVTPLNSIRESLNRAQFERHCQQALAALTAAERSDISRLSWRKIGAVRVLATFGELIGKGKQTIESSEISKKKLKALYEVEEKDLCRLAGRLDLIVGGRVLVTSNVSVDKGIANGTSATVEQLLLHEDEVRWSQAAQCFVVEARHVQGLVLRTHQKPFDQLDLYPPLEPGRFPISKLGKNRSIASFRWEKGQMTSVKSAAQSNCRFRVTQLPVVPKNVLTVHKVQGQTTDNLVVLPLGDKSTGKAGLLYVCLSRVKSLQNIFLTEPFPDDPSLFKKRADVINHMNKIREKWVIPTTIKMDRLFTELGLRQQEPSLSRLEISSSSASSQPPLPVRQEEKKGQSS